MGADHCPIDPPVVFFLNAYNVIRSWPPYRPFTLSIRKRRHLYNFIRGGPSLFVVLDVSLLCRQFTAEGLELTFNAENDPAFEYWDPRNGIGGCVFHHFVQRIGLEFLSPAFLMDEIREKWRRSLHHYRSPAIGPPCRETKHQAQGDLGRKRVSRHRAK